MTVAELRAALESMPDDADIAVLGFDGSPTVTEVTPDDHNDTEPPIVWITLGIFDGDDGYKQCVVEARKDGYVWS